MNRLLKIVLAVCVLVTLISAEITVETGEATNNSTTAGDELTKDEIYNINSDMYCITNKIIKEKAFDLVNPKNLYTSILDDDVKDMDCEAILEEYVARVHKRLRQDFKKKGANKQTIDCFMNKIVELGYDEMRFKFTSLYGLEIETEKKEGLRTAIDKQIGDIVETAVDQCWQEDSTKKAESENIV